MPIVFGLVGILLVVSGVRGQSSQLFTLVKSDFSGQPNYFEWMIAIFIVGAIGYVKELSTISRMFMFIVLAGLLYQNKQFFSDIHGEETANSTGTNVVPQSMQQGTPGLPALTPLASLPSLDPSIFE